MGKIVRKTSDTKTTCFVGKNHNASTKPGEWVLDPFCGSSTTGIAANLLGRRYLGIDQEEKYIEISKNRREELENLQTYHKYRSKIKDIQYMDSLYPSMIKEDSDMIYGDLPFQIMQ